MAAFPITLVGKSTVDLAGNTVFTGEAFTSGLQIGGGPMPGGPPLGIWGGPYFPPVIWPGPGPLPYPDQGLPGPQPTPQPPGGGAGSWRWVYSPIYGWVLDPGAGGKPQPPGGAGSQPGQPPGEQPSPPDISAIGPAHPIQPTEPEWKPEG